jgi:hypothetical protein
MKKGMGRSAAVLAMSSAASVALTFGPGLAAAHAFDDKDNHNNRCDDKKDDGWDLFGDKGDKDGRDGRDHKDGGDRGDGDKLGRADNLDGNRDGGRDGRDDGKDNGRDNKDDDWFNWDDKDKDKDRRHNCPVGGGIVAGVGVGVVGGAGGVAAGGGGMADRGSSPLLPVAGATVGALLIGAGVARRRAQGAA